MMSLTGLAMGLAASTQGLFKPKEGILGRPERERAAQPTNCRADANRNDDRLSCDRDYR
jgi:hypothetical protein